MTLAGFGGVAGFFALFFFTDVPRVRKDIVTKIPIIGQHYVKEVPASDNVGFPLFFGFPVFRMCGMWKERESSTSGSIWEGSAQLWSGDVEDRRGTELTSK